MRWPNFIIWKKIYVKSSKKLSRFICPCLLCQMNSYVIFTIGFIWFVFGRLSSCLWCITNILSHLLAIASIENIWCLFMNTWVEVTYEKDCMVMATITLFFFSFI
jgi:hypothetical protein